MAQPAKMGSQVGEPVKLTGKCIQDGTFPFYSLKETLPDDLHQTVFDQAVPPMDINAVDPDLRIMGIIGANYPKKRAGIDAIDG